MNYTATRSTYHEHPILPLTGRERLRRSSPNSSLAEMQADIDRVRRYQPEVPQGGCSDNHNAGSAPKLAHGASHPVCPAIRRHDIDYLLSESLGTDMLRKRYATFCESLGRRDIGNRRLVRRFIKSLMRKK